MVQYFFLFVQNASFLKKTKIIQLYNLLVCVCILTYI